MKGVRHDYAVVGRRRCALAEVVGFIALFAIIGLMLGVAGNLHPLVIR